MPITSAYTLAGGFIGYFDATGYCYVMTIDNSKATGSVTSSYGQIGGFAGSSNCGPGFRITGSVATGDVTRTTTGTWYNTAYGGFCGANCKATNSYSTGNVRTQDTSSERKGGFCGNSCVTTNSYSIGKLQYMSGGSYVLDNASADSGGFCGLSGSCTATNSFWSTDNSRAASVGGGVGVTEAQLKAAATLTGVGWGSPWVLIDGLFPYLNWQ